MRCSAFESGSETTAGIYAFPWVGKPARAPARAASGPVLNGSRASFLHHDRMDTSPDGVGCWRETSLIVLWSPPSLWRVSNRGRDGNERLTSPEWWIQHVGDAASVSTPFHDMRLEHHQRVEIADRHRPQVDANAANRGGKGMARHDRADDHAR